MRIYYQKAGVNFAWRSKLRPIFLYLSYKKYRSSRFKGRNWIRKTRIRSPKKTI